MSNDPRDLLKTLSDHARRLEIELKGDATALRHLTMELIEDLSVAFGQPGYDEALVASRNILALELGITAADIGDLADAEMRGIVLGLLAGVAGA